MDILYDGKVIVKDEASTLVASIVKQLVKYTRNSKYTRLIKIKPNKLNYGWYRNSRKRDSNEL